MDKGEAAPSGEAELAMDVAPLGELRVVVGEPVVGEVARADAAVR